MSELVFQRLHNKEVFEIKCPNCKEDIKLEVRQGCSEDDIFVKIKKIKDVKEKENEN